MGQCRVKHYHLVCDHLSQKSEFNSEEANLRLAQSVWVFRLQSGPVCPAWFTAGPESSAAFLAPQVCTVPEMLLQNSEVPPLSQPGLFSGMRSYGAALGELMLAPIQSWPSSHLPCSHPTHRTPVGVPTTEAGRKPRKKHSSSSFLFFLLFPSELPPSLKTPTERSEVSLNQQL